MPCSCPSCAGPRGRPPSTTGRSTEPPTTPVGAEADICQGRGISRHDGEHRRDHRRPPRTTSVIFYRAGSWSHGEYKRKGEPAPCRGTIRAVATRPETGLSRQEATLGRRPPRQPRGAPRKARTCSRTKITVRAFVSQRCHDHPEWTSNNHDTQSRGRTPTIRRITERNTWSPPSSRGATYTGRPAATLPHLPEEWTRSSTTRQTVRAFGQKCASRRSERIHGRKWKRPAELAFHNVGLTGFEPATPCSRSRLCRAWHRLSGVRSDQQKRRRWATASCHLLS